MTQTLRLVRLIHARLQVTFLLLNTIVFAGRSVLKCIFVVPVDTVWYRYVK